MRKDSRKYWLSWIPYQTIMFITMENFMFSKKNQLVENNSLKCEWGRYGSCLIALHGSLKLAVHTLHVVCSAARLQRHHSVHWSHVCSIYVAWVSASETPQIQDGFEWIVLFHFFWFIVFKAPTFTQSHNNIDPIIAQIRFLLHGLSKKRLCL